MKKIILNICFLTLLCFISYKGLAQNPVILDAKNEMSVDVLNCWDLIDVSGYSPPHILASRPFFKEKGITSPWIKFNGIGRIKWEMMQYYPPFSTIPRFALIKIDVNNVVDTIFKSSPKPYTPYLENIAVNFSGVYKLKFISIQTVLDGSIALQLNDISIDGDYWSSPSNSCSPKSPVNNDTDGDGVTNANDAFPDDPLRAFVSFSPTNNFGTLMFEDQWPKKGDYDFNDVVVEYRIKNVLNAQNNIVESYITAITKALGGSFSNGFMYQLLGVAPEKVLSVTGSKLSGSKWVDLASNGTEKNQDYANIVVFDNGNAFLSNGTGNLITNVELDKPYFTPDTVKIKISFDTDTSNGPVKTINFDPYIIANQNRGTEIHLTTGIPSKKADRSLFNTYDDASTLSRGYRYRTSENLPWAISIDQIFPYMQEQKDFTTGYSKFTEWALSGGISFSDWYKDKPGYRNNNNLYTK